MRFPQQPASSMSSSSPAMLSETAPAWMSEDEELALGCESANPALQIERWLQDEAQALQKPY